jgi:hypothetical protein
MRLFGLKQVDRELPPLAFSFMAPLVFVAVILSEAKEFCICPATTSEPKPALCEIVRASHAPTRRNTVHPTLTLGELRATAPTMHYVLFDTSQRLLQPEEYVNAPTASLSP